MRQRSTRFVKIADPDASAQNPATLFDPIRTLRSLLIFLLAIGCLTACEPEQRTRMANFREMGVLKVATRMDATSYREDEDGSISGFEYDLLQRLGDELGVPVQFEIYPDAARAIDAVLNGDAHLAAAGLARNDRFPLHWSSALRDVEFVLAGRQDTGEIGKETDLAGRTVTLRRGSLAGEAIERIRKRVPTLSANFVSRIGDQALLARLAEGEFDLVATDRIHLSYAAQIAPELSAAYVLPTKSHVAWAMPIEGDGGLAEQVTSFLEASRSNGLIARISDRYFGHIKRLDEQDITTFLVRVQERLPRYLRYFQEAEAQSGIDWRYLAAVAYQESHWDPLATSRTGVRGIMMLTSDTADRLGVSDRLDARQSILGGAKYVSMLVEQLPDEVPSPDRLWMATAAYNLGMGHFNGARSIARSLGKDETSWWDMKSVLPLMSRPNYAARLKSGPARGGEAVIMTENVRNYHDILTRLQTLDAPQSSSPRLRLSRQD